MDTEFPPSPRFRVIAPTRSEVEVAENTSAPPVPVKVSAGVTILLPESVTVFVPLPKSTFTPPLTVATPAVALRVNVSVPPIEFTLRAPPMSTALAAVTTVLLEPVP